MSGHIWRNVDGIVLERDLGMGHPGTITIDDLRNYSVMLNIHMYLKSCWICYRSLAARMGDSARLHSSFVAPTCKSVSST